MGVLFHMYFYGINCILYSIFLHYVYFYGLITRIKDDDEIYHMMMMKSTATQHFTEMNMCWQRKLNSKPSCMESSRRLPGQLTSTIYLWMIINWIIHCSSLVMLGLHHDLLHPHIQKWLNKSCEIWCSKTHHSQCLVTGLVGGRLSGWFYLFRDYKTTEKGSENISYIVKQQSHDFVQEGQIVVMWYLHDCTLIKAISQRHTVGTLPNIGHYSDVRKDICRMNILKPWPLNELVYLLSVFQPGHCR